MARQFSAGAGRIFHSITGLFGRSQKPLEQPSATYWGRAWRALRRDRAAMAGLAILALIAFSAVFADLIAPHDPIHVTPGDRLLSPSTTYLLGTDHLGRDILSRILFGARTSLLIVIAVVSLGTPIGTLCGLVAGYLGGTIDTIIMRIMDGFMAFPGLILILAIIAVLGPGLANGILALGILVVPGVTRLVRGNVLAIREELYVEASRAVGAGVWYIVFWVILPGTFPILLVHLTLHSASIILVEAALSFLNLGVPPPTPSWGMMLYDGRSYMSSAPWFVFSPGAIIFLVVLALVLLGDGLGDALDPRRHGVH